MPRYARTMSKSQVYHVILRGNNKGWIFIDDEDKYRILGTLKEKKADQGFYLYAYCIMDNHIHLLVKEGNDSISKIIKRIATSYALYFNKKYKRIGHVFQDRYKSENIEDERYLLSAIRYIHQNPVKAGIGKIGTYKWSSYKLYMEENKDFKEINEILAMYSEDKSKARSLFVKFNKENACENFLEIEQEKEINRTNIQEFVEKFVREKGINLEEIKHKKTNTSVMNL